MREWLVGGALMEASDGLLLVRNVRHDGWSDWTTPGGVIDAADASVLSGLAREVEEETGFRVTRWEGPLYRVRCVAPDMEWTLHVEVHRAVEFDGELKVDDPDGIVDEARFFAPDECRARVTEGARWVHEPLSEWLDQRWDCSASRGYHYDVRGTRRDALSIRRETP